MAFCVSQSHNGHVTINKTTLKASDDVPVATYVSYSSAIMIPEKAGGRAPATTSIIRWLLSIWNNIPTTRSASGIISNLSIDPKTACQLILILTDDNVMPAAKTATEAFALAIRSNDGENAFGQGTPAITNITARIGAQATGWHKA